VDGLVGYHNFGGFKTGAQPGFC